MRNKSTTELKKRAISPKKLIETKFDELDFTGDWLSLIGKPELRGSWIIWGQSTNGKTRFALQLAKYLAQFGKVVYDSLEEGASLSMQRAVKDLNMLEVNNKFYLLDNEPIDALIGRLKTDTQIKAVIIDSLQYSGITIDIYKRLKALFAKKLLIFVSHADGKEPAGAVARAVRYDAFVKIWIEGYKAFAQSRYGGGQPYTIWQEGADKYWTE